MKKCLYALLALAAVLSCTRQEKDVRDEILSGREMTFTACFEDAPTRTTLVNGTKVYWQPGDKIGIYTETASASFQADTKVTAAESSFSGTIVTSSKYYAFYPFEAGASYRSGVFQANLPGVQEAVDGNVANGLLYSAGTATANGKIPFNNLLSGICFTISSEGVKYVELKGNLDEYLAGALQVNAKSSPMKADAVFGSSERVIRLYAPGGGSFKPNTSYYLVCFPTVFENGFSLEMFKGDGSSAIYSISTHVELKRSVFGRINSADKGLAFTKSGLPEGQLPPDDEIWYTTIDNKPLLTVGNQGDKTLVSHTYQKGMGVLRYSGPLTRVERLTIGYDTGDRLTCVLLPDCVEYIGSSLLLYAQYVTEFRIPAALKETGGNSFICKTGSSLERFTGRHVTEDGRCVIIDGVLHGFAPAGLSSYTFPDGIQTLQTAVCAFSPELKSAVIPAGVREVGSFCFQGSGIESVTIPASVVAIGTYAFLDCNHLKNLLGDSHFISADRKYLVDPDAYYPMTLLFFAGREDESYAIPEGVQAIEHYAFKGCDRLRSLTFPNSLFFISGTSFEDCNHLETLLGSHTTKDHKGFVNEGHQLLFLVPQIDEDFVVPDDVTGLGSDLFADRQNLRSVRMGDQVTTLGNYVFSNCTNLKTIVLSANLNSIGYNPFRGDVALEAVHFRSLVPPSYTDSQFTPVSSRKIYVPEQSLQLYKSNVGWKDYWDAMLPYAYTDLPKPDFYISSDYSREGEVTVYQRASEGNGIDLVFMGDAYSDREVESGRYLADMKACAEEYFAVEPYKSFRHLFNIYFVTTVSATEGYEHGGQSLGSARGAGTYISGNDAKCFDLALKAVKDKDRLDETLVVVCGNQDLSGTIYVCGTCFMFDPTDWAGRDYANGPAVCYFLKQDNSFAKTGNTIRHEAGGHGFAKLADEYNYSGSLSQTDRERLNSYAPYRWYSNVDITSDPASIKWSAFLSDKRYQNDGLGIYEGGFTYEYGVWRPSETSIMLNNLGRFNAPSRYTIWYRIHKLAYGKNWKGSYEDFVAYDAVNRVTSSQAAPQRRQNAVELPLQAPHAPVATGRTWREAERR